jgi:hypothetical protein
MAPLAEFLRGLDNIASVEPMMGKLDRDQLTIFRLENRQGEVAFVLVVTPSMQATSLIKSLKSFSHSPLLVLVAAPPPAAGATLCNWRDEHSVLARLHALFFGKLYYWWDEQVTAVHFVDHNGNRTAQPAPPDRYPFTRLHTSAPHDCFHTDLEGYQWRTMSFGERVWWVRSEYNCNTRTRQERQSTERPPMSDAEFQEYLRRVREEARRIYEQPHYTPPPPVRSRNQLSAALATLDLTGSATPEQIKTAYRAKARQLHPDQNPAPDATRQMQELNLAYETLMRS